MPVLARYLRKEHSVHDLNEEEESRFMILTAFNSFCSSCSNFVTLNCSILLAVNTAYGLNQLHGFR